MARPVTFQTLIEDTRRWANIRTSTPDDAHQTDSDVARILELKLAELHEMLTSSTASAFVETEADVSIVNGAGDLPEDFFRLNAAWVVWSSSDHEPLTNLSNQQYAASYAGSSWTAGASKAFRIVGSQLRVFPAATSATVRIAYVPAFATADEYDGVNGWEKYVTVGAAIEILAIENRTNAALEREYERQSERILSMIEERQAQDPPRIRDASCPEPSRSCGGGGTGGGGATVPISVAASAVTYSPTAAALQSTNVQGALDELGGYATMALLRAVAPVNGKQARTRTYATDGDGGGGLWRGVVTAPLTPGTYTHNGGTVLVPFDGDGSRAWLRELNGDPITPEMFGAVGNGTTNDKAALVACFAAAGETEVRADKDYLVSGGNLALATGLQLSGCGTFRVDSSTLNPLLTGTSLSGVRLHGLTLIGNAADQTSDSSGSSGIDLDTCSDIELSLLSVSGWTRHGIALDGVTDVTVDCCNISDSYHGAGVLCASTTVSHRVRVTNCKITDTQLANVHAFVGVTDWVVENNYLDGTGAGSGSLLDGEVADNITCYPDDLSLVRAKIHHNHCKNSANHGIHVGGDYVTVSDNYVTGQAYIGILFYAGSGSAPNPDAVGLTVSGNDVSSSDRTDSDHKGISVRNVTGFVANNNRVTDCYDAFEIRFIDGSPATGKYTQMGTVAGNTIIDAHRYGIELNGYVRGVELGPNTIRIADASGEHVRYNTTDATGRADNPLSSGNVYLGSGTAPRVLNIQQGTASVATKLKATGSSTNINAAVEGKGNGVILLGNDNGYGAQVSAGTASTVNRVELVGSVSGTAVRINAAGDDTNIRQDVQGKGTGGVRIEPTSGRVGFMGATPIQRPTVTGSRGGNAALASLLTELANLGLITDSSS